MMRGNSLGWGSYLKTFHQDLPGITEDVLGVSISAGQTPYEWLLNAISPGSDLLDIACGSAPTLRAGWSSPWTGVDRSRAELDRARFNGGRNLATAEATELPFADRQFTSIVCSMALMLLEPIDDCLTEMVRVLSPGGDAVFLLPGGGVPLIVSDWWRWGSLLIALRQTRFRYPNDRSLQRMSAVVAPHGLTIVGDERRRFVHPIADVDAADRFIDSLYLPGITAARKSRARRLARSWVGSDIGIPLRRVRMRCTS
jgi:SAM-dependent methyltransferase